MASFPMASFRLILFVGFACCLFAAGVVNTAASPIPVIYDTDLGDDIDDTWALALILASPELDLKLVVTDSHDTPRKAKLAARFLEQAGYSHIPIGIGAKMSDKPSPQYQLIEEYDLADYPGEVYEDGIQAIIDVVQNTEETVVLFVVGPCPNIPILLERAPWIVDQVRVIAMSGSVDRGYGDGSAPTGEYNVRDDIEAARAMYEADWDLTITPLDTADRVRLTGETYQRLLRNPNPLIEAIIDNYRAWASGHSSHDPDTASSTLFDTVAIYLAIDESFCVMEEIPLRVDERGHTVRDPEAKIIRVAIDWADLEAYENWMVERLLSAGSAPANLPAEDQ